MTVYLEIKVNSFIFILINIINILGFNKEHCTIIIAHRLSTVKIADEIIVIDKGTYFFSKFPFFSCSKFYR